MSCSPDIRGIIRPTAPTTSGGPRARDHRRPAGRAHLAAPRARRRLRGVRPWSRRCARSSTQAPQYEQRIFYGDRLLVVVTLNGRHLPPGQVKETGLHGRRPARRPAAGRRRLTLRRPAGRRAPSPRAGGVAPGPPSRVAVGRDRSKEGRAVKLWATRETRTELLMACLRVLMGAIFLAVWSDNLIKGYYSPERLGGLRAALRRHDQGEPVRRRPELRHDPQLGRVRLRAVRHRVRRVRAVPGARPLHAGVGAARGAVPAEPAGRDVGDRRVAGHLHHHVRAAARRSASRRRAGRSGWTRCSRGGTRTRGCRSTDPRPGRRRRAAGRNPEQPQPEQAPEDVAHRAARSRARCRRSWSVPARAR